MSKLRVAFIISLMILGVLVVFTVFLPISIGKGCTEVQKAGVLQAEDEWIIQFDIINNEGMDTGYGIEVSRNNKVYRTPVIIPDNGRFTYIHRIPFNAKGNKDITFAIYKEGEEVPVEQVTYYLKQNNNGQSIK